MKRFDYARSLHHYETDSDGVCHFSNYLRIFEEAFAAAVRELSNGTAVPHAFAVTEANASYHQPLRYGDHFVVRLGFDTVRRSFFSASAEVFLNDQLSARISAKFAAVSAQDNRSIGLDPAFRAALTAIQLESDHASK